MSNERHEDSLAADQARLLEAAVVREAVRLRRGILTGDYISWHDAQVTLASATDALLMFLDKEAADE